MEIQNAGALGTGDIVFNGGALKYGTGITTDISGQLKTDALASNAILVDTNGNAVTWASLAGWAGTLTRSGEGSLMLGGFPDHRSGKCFSDRRYWRYHKQDGRRHPDYQQEYFYQFQRLHASGGKWDSFPEAG